MCRNPLVSVIIPAFNASAYIGQCIENIQFQTYKNIEILVIDDGSTDETAKLAEAYGVKVIRQSNKGVSSARNKGIKNASGDYFHFMDVDDLINHQFYESLVKCALSYSADVICCNVFHEKNAKHAHILRGVFVASNTEDKLSLSKVGEDGHCFKYLIRREVLTNNAILFDENLGIQEDLVFCLQVVYHSNRLGYSNSAVYFYKDRPNSALGTFNLKRKSDRKKVLAPVKEFESSFRKNHQLSNIGQDPGISTNYWIFGVPILRCKRWRNGVAKWYFLGVCVLRRKII